jgi:hypothetical protein
MAHRTLLHSGGPGQNDWLTGTWYRKRWPWTLKSAHDHLKGEDKDLGFGEIISIGDIHMTTVTLATKVADPRGKDHSVHWQDQHGQSHYVEHRQPAVQRDSKQLGRMSIEVEVSLLGYQTGDKAQLAGEPFIILGPS